MALWVIVLPFLGFPYNWKVVLFVITGISLLYLAYLFYAETKTRLSKYEENETKTFVDNIEETHQQI